MIHFVVHDEGDGVGVVVVEGVKAGQELTGWIMDQDKDIKVDGEERHPDRPQAGDQATQAGRHRHQVRRRHRQGGRADRARRAPARAQRQDEALVRRHGHLESDLLGLPARERPHRRAQPRHHPAGGRPVQRRRARRWRNNIKGTMAHPASLRPAAVRRRPRPALPHADRHRLQPERRRRGRDRHRGRLDEEGRRRHRQDRQAGGRLRHRAARRPRHHHARLEEGARSSCSGRPSCAARSGR